MKLGILVTTDHYLPQVKGLVEAAVRKNHEVMLFVMDDGTRLLESEAFSGLCGVKGVGVSYCEHATQQTGVQTAGLPEQAVCGSQFDNANMMHEADRVIVL